MDTQRIGIGLGIGLIVLVGAAVFFGGVRPSPASDSLAYVSLPDGFDIGTYAENFSSSGVSYPGPNPGPRMIEFYNGTMYVSIPNQGRVVALLDDDGNGKPDSVVTAVDGLDQPHGLAFRDDAIYVAETGRVLRYQLDGLATVPKSREVLIDAIPAGGQHWTRSLLIHDDRLFISVGSSCNACRESNTWRAAVSVCTLNGEDCRVYADGLRNVVGLTTVADAIVVTENGRDFLGNDLPPDEINVLQDNGTYGWPECYGKNVQDPKFVQDVEYVRAPCSEPFELPSTVDIQAHSAPLGLTQYTGDAFPPEYRNDLYVAYHGSWNRQPPTGYKIVRVPYNGTFGDPIDFATGWLAGTTVKGRPVDTAVGPDRALYISDDNAGKIYRITYQD